MTDGGAAPFAGSVLEPDGEARAAGVGGGAFRLQLSREHLDDAPPEGAGLLPVQWRRQILNRPTIPFKAVDISCSVAALVLTCPALRAQIEGWNNAGSMIGMISGPPRRYREAGRKTSVPD